MFRFAHSACLYLLALVPVLMLVYFFLGRARRRALGRFAQLPMIVRLSGSASPAKRRVKFGLLLGALVCLILALADPQMGTRMQEVKAEGVDLFIALDVSLSMKAEDIKPSRLAKAKLEIRNLIGRLRGDRLGLILFAGEAYTQFPLTTDYGAAELFLDGVDVDSVPVPGTSLTSALQRAMESFDFKEASSKVLVIITDGEETEGNAFSAVEEAAKKGVRVYCIGMGSPEGAPIPVYGGGAQPSDFKRDKAGSVVVTRLDEASLEKLATAGSGKYVRAANARDELEEIHRDINTLQKRASGAKQFTDYEDRFQYFLVPALLLLLLEGLLSEQRIAWLQRWNPLGVRR